MRSDQTTDTDEQDTGDATDTGGSDTGDDQEQQSDSGDTGGDSTDTDDDDTTDDDTIDADGYTPAQRAELDQLTEQSKQKDDHISSQGRELADARQRIADLTGGDDAAADDSNQGGDNEYSHIDTTGMPEPLIEGFNVLDASVKKKLTEMDQTIAGLRQDRQREEQFQAYQEEYGGDRESFDSMHEAIGRGDVVSAVKIVNLNSAATNARKQQQTERDRLRTRSTPSGGSSYSSQQGSDDGNPVQAEVERINKLPASQKQDAISAIYGKYEGELADQIASAIT